MRELIKDYKRTRRMCRRKAKEAERSEERTEWNAMASHADFVVQWLETGRQPGNMRGIERRSVYELTTLVDPTNDKDPSLSYNPFDEPKNKTDEERKKEALLVENILLNLSNREREIFVMRYERLMKRREIAEELGITVGTVAQTLKRAEEKLGYLSSNAHYI